MFNSHLPYIKIVGNVNVGIPKSLSEAGVKREDIPFLAESAFNDACTPGNPRDASMEEIIAIYESIF